MPFKNLLFLLFIFYYNIVFAQSSAESPPKNFDFTPYDNDFEKLYQNCTKTRLDSAHKLQIAFLRKYYVIRDKKRLYDYCGKFKNKCLKDNNKALLRRLLVIETVDKLKYQKPTPTQVETAFNALYDTFLEENDVSAALECLLEFGLFPHKEKTDIQALKILFFAEKFAQKNNLQNDISLQGILYRIGYILWDFDMPILSIKYLKKSLETNKTNYSDSLITLNAMGINYQKLNDYQNSIKYFDVVSALAKKGKSDIFYAVVLGNAAVTLHKLGEQNKAFAYATQDKEMCFREKLWSNAVGALHTLIRIEIKRNNLENAKILLDSLDNVALKANDKHFISQKRQKEAAFLYYQALKNHEKSLSFYKEFVYYDSLAQEYANKNKISELQLAAEVRIYQQEMDEREKDKQSINVLFVISIILLILLIVFVGFFVNKKIKTIEINKKVVENINKTQAQEIAILKQQIFAQLADIKQNNNSLQAIILPKNNPEDIKEDINQIGKDIDNANPQKEIHNENLVENLDFDTENISVKEEDLQFLREFNLTKKEQWSIFKVSFLKVYPNFERKIITKMGEVSNAELRLMMLQKLGLDNNEISQMLLISANSVRTGKYRLYKKLGLSSAEELDNFL